VAIYIVFKRYFCLLIIFTCSCTRSIVSYTALAIFAQDEQIFFITAVHWWVLIYYIIIFLKRSHGTMMLFRSLCHNFGFVVIIVILFGLLFNLEINHVVSQSSLVVVTIISNNYLTLTQTIVVCIVLPICLSLICSRWRFLFDVKIVYSHVFLGIAELIKYLGWAMTVLVVIVTVRFRQFFNSSRHIVRYLMSLLIFTIVIFSIINFEIICSILKKCF